MSETVAREPQAEQYGLCTEDLSRLPPPWVESHRGVLVVGIVGLAVAVVFAVVLAVSGSLPAASFFAVVGGAASLVLLLPAAMLLLCAAGRAEDRLRARRDPLWRACVAYRDAVDAYQRRQERRSARPDPGDEVAWRRLGHEALVAAAADRFTGGGWVAERAEDPVRTGVDLLLHGAGGRRAAARCESGAVPASLARVRELVAVRADLGVDRLVLVCPGGLDPDAREYATGHGLEVLDGPVLAGRRQRP